MKLREIQTIGVIGAGLMGHSIAQHFSIKGFKVNIFDNNKKVLGDAPRLIKRNLGIYEELQLIESSEIDTCLQNLILCQNMDEVCVNADLIIEAVSENLTLKQKIFAELESRVSSDTILCSNTSAISISKICENFHHKERVVGTHFWNPPHIIPCVEVIKSNFTSDDVFETVIELLKKVKKEPIRVLKDVPGFLGNRLQHAMWREAISLAENNIASSEDIDKVVKYGFGLRLAFIGPLETADLAGLDLVNDVEKYLFPYLESASSPSPVLKKLVQKGELGVQSNKGFYDWTEEKADKMINQRDFTLLKILKVLFPKESNS